MSTKHFLFTNNVFIYLFSHFGIIENKFYPSLTSQRFSSMPKLVNFLNHKAKGIIEIA